MKRHIQLWGTRTFAVVLLVVAVQQWGMPSYKRYFTTKKAAVYVPTTKVRAGTFVVSFHEIGTLKAENSVPINSDVDGKIISLVAEGKVVKAGDKLIEIDTTELLREIRNKQLSLKNAQAEVERVKSELILLQEENKTKVAQAEATLAFNKAERDAAKQAFDSKTALAKDKLIPRTDVDRAEIELRAKELAVTKGEMDLILQKKDVQAKESQKAADVRTKEYAMSMSKFDLEDVESRIKKAVITAPAGGMVVLCSIYTPEGRRKVKEGDNPWRRQTLCELPDLSSMQAKVNVGEADAPRLRVGMPVLLRLEAVRKKVFHGSVKEISSLATEKDPWESGATPGKKNFEVTVQVKEVDPSTLKPGMTADVEFIVDSKKNSVYVPLESVIERGGKTWVYVKGKKGYDRTTVKTGEANDSFVCVTKGLTGNQTIALRDPTRSMDEQEAGSYSSESNEKEKKEKVPAPIPEATKK